MSPEGPLESLPPTSDSRRTSLTDFGYKEGMSQDNARDRLDVDIKTTKEPVKPEQSTTTVPDSNAVTFTPTGPKPYDWQEEDKATEEKSSDTEGLKDSA